MKQITPQEIEQTERNRLTHDLDSTQQHFSTSNEPLINGVPLSKFTEYKLEQLQPTIDILAEEGLL